MRNYKTLFAICHKQGIEYKDVVAEFTEGRTDSLKALTDGEFREMMIRLSKKNEPERKAFTPKPGDRQRKKMIAIARDMRWDVRGKEVMMQRINDWCVNSTKYKKTLNNLSVDELNKVLYIFEHEVKKSFLNNI